MTYEEALGYIHSICWQKSVPGLSRIGELCKKLGDPQKKLRFIHVAGTNGKGSTSAMTASVLRAAGYNVGLYTSPYIVRFNERMQINGQNIPDAELASVTEYVKPFAESMEDLPTEFELITAIAFVYFANHGCDYVVLEAGMGGRLDSTNIIEAENVAVSVITGIAMDHTAFLGNTDVKIAAEKAGIIKAGVPVVFGGAHTPVGAKADCEVDP
jgi:dihydrofolate synthase/folylpolyglutamate synthase